MKIQLKRVKRMGYYDFDDHFWSPREVCAQTPAKVNQERFLKAPKLRQTIFRLVWLLLR